MQNTYVRQSRTHCYAMILRYAYREQLAPIVAKTEPAAQGLRRGVVRTDFDVDGENTALRAFTKQLGQQRCSHTMTAERGPDEQIVDKSVEASKLHAVSGR